MPAIADTQPSRRTLLAFCGSFVLANSLLLAAIFGRNLMLSGIPRELPALLFTLSAFWGHAVFVLSATFLLLVPLVLLLPRWGTTIVASALVVTLALALAFVDGIVFQQYRFHLNAEVAALIFGGAAEDILPFSAAMLAQALGVLVIVLAAEIAAGRWLRRWTARPACLRLQRRAWAIAAGILVLGQGLHVWADAAGYSAITRQVRLLPAYRPLTAAKQLRRAGFHVAEKTEDPAAATGGALNYPREPVVCTPEARPPDIFLIVIDSWRFDMLDPETTPQIAQFAPRCQRFTDHWAGASASRTGIFTLFYSIPGTYWHDAVAEKRGPVLFSELRRQGYAIDVFTYAPLDSPEFDRTVFVELDSYRGRTEGKRVYERDRNVTRDFERFLAARDTDRPTFAFLWYGAPHHFDLPPDDPAPFQPSWKRVNFLELGPDFDPTSFLNRYRNTLHFVDALVGEALDAIARAGLLETSVVIITGDHAQEFNDLGLNYWGHNGNFTRFQASVPLLVAWPGRAGAVHTHRTSAFDIAPSLMQQFLGCTGETAGYSVGRQLLEPGGRELLLLSNYNDYALVRPDGVVAVSPHGVEFLDPDYRPRPETEADRAALRESLQLRSRFYR